MARLAKFECDRCGAHYDKNHAKDLHNRCDQNLVGVGLLNTSGHIFRMDLCDACMEELQSFLDDPKTFVADQYGKPVSDLEEEEEESKD